MDTNTIPLEPYVWKFYPPGWRRDAFRRYEENLVEGDDRVDLINNESAARQIKTIIEPHVGFHEIVACEIWSASEVRSYESRGKRTFLGFDVAYIGGDFYSAILNGLFVNPSSALQLRYKSVLNQFGLFPTPGLIPEFLFEFKRETLSEQSSEFYVWALELVP